MSNAVFDAAAASTLIAPQPVARSAPKATSGDSFADQLQKQQKQSAPASDTQDTTDAADDSDKTDKTDKAKPKSDAAPVKKKDPVKKPNPQNDAATDADVDADASDKPDPAAPVLPDVAPKADDDADAKVDDVADGKKAGTKEKQDAAALVKLHQGTHVQASIFVANTPATTPVATDKTAKTDLPLDTSSEITAIDATKTKAAAAPKTPPATKEEKQTAATKTAESPVHPSKAKPAAGQVAVQANDTAKPKAADPKTAAPAQPANAVDPATLVQQAADAKAPQPTGQLLPVATAAQAAAPQKTVAQTNIDRIVTSVRGELSTKGGSMQIRLDPPTLGTVNIQVNVNDGVLTASIQTENDQATRLLSHNLTDLKSTLESAGVSVDRIQVKQSPTSESSSNNGKNSDQDSQRQSAQDNPARQDQQRREMLQRMWRKFAMGDDPLDLVA